MLRVLELVFFSLVLLTSACKKAEEVVPISGNRPPMDTVAPAVGVETYINKLSIILLGRKPSLQERNNYFNTLQAGQFSVSSRLKVLEKVMADSLYYPRVFDVARANLLNNLDTLEITERINIILNDANRPGQERWRDIQMIEVERLTKLRSVPVQLKAQQITTQEMHRRCVDNTFYDEINMGTQNFVLSLFENFLHRYPTDQELAVASKMVDGERQILFGEIGRSKDDCIQIVLNSNDYFEGLITMLFRQYLFRVPTSAEIQQYLPLVKRTRDFQTLQKQLLTSDEFAGSNR